MFTCATSTPHRDLLRYACCSQGVRGFTQVKAEAYGLLLPRTLSRTAPRGIERLTKGKGAKLIKYIRLRLPNYKYIQLITTLVNTVD